jgi:hypothetical protein
MKYTNEQKNQLRQSLKAAGYGCRIQEKQSPFSDKIVTFISFIPAGEKPVMVTGAGVFGADFYQKHKVAFEIINQFKGE